MGLGVSRDRALAPEGLGFEELRGLNFGGLRSGPGVKGLDSSCQ